MLKEFIDRIVELGKTEIIDQGGVSYSTKALYPVKDPSIDEFHISSLQGVVDLLDHIAFPGEHVEPIVMVEGWNKVIVVNHELDTWNRRQVYIQATPPELKAFPFGRFMEHEEFAINLLSLFADEPNQHELLKITSKLTSEKVHTSEDDGASQKVTLRKGVATREGVTVSPLIVLQPFRTFLEIPQPPSTFLFRLKQNGDALPQCALFEADGGAWKIKAMESIQRWLIEKVGEKYPVIM